MVRVKQWCIEDNLSYLLVESVSRRSALVDADPSLVDDYRRVLQMRGLHNMYLLYTGDNPVCVDLPGELITPGQWLPGDVLPLGETHVERFLNGSSTLAAYVCEGHVFSGDWLLPFTLRQINADPIAGVSCMLPLINFPDDHIIHPGKVVSGIRISTLAQEKSLAGMMPSPGDFHD